MRSKRSAAVLCDKNLKQIFVSKVDVNEKVNNRNSVISENEFNESDTDSFEIDNYSNSSASESELSSVSNNIESMASKNSIVKNFLNDISSAALSLRIRNYDYSSGSTLMQSYFIKHLGQFLNLSQSVYWADKLLLELNHNLLIRTTIVKALYPPEDIFTECSDGNNLTKLLSTITISEDDTTQHILSGLHSVCANNQVSSQNGVFINAGSYVKKMCWAPINPDLYNDQFLAVVNSYDSYKQTLDSTIKNCSFIQLYCFRALTMGTMSMATPDLEMVLVQDWGEIHDICWSPQPLPVVARSVILIGHLAVACEDGLVRILPLMKRDSKSEVVTVVANCPILCLGNVDIRGTYPTCIDWCKQHPNRVAVGYSSGDVAIFILEVGVATDSATITNGEIHIRPHKFHEVLNTPVKSVQISPNNWSQVAVTSAIKPSAIIVDMSSMKNPPIVLDKTSISASTLIWPDPGDIITIVGGYNPSGTTGLVFYAVHQPTKNYTKLPITDLSVASFNVALNVMAIGTNDGKLHVTSVNGADMKRLLSSKNSDNKCRVESGIKTKFYHQYFLRPILVAETGNEDIVMSESVKCEQAPVATNCKCVLAPGCIHELLSQYSVSVSKTEDMSPLNWQLQAVVRINGIAINTNPGSATWVAVSLKCGLIHIVPLTHFYNCEFDKMVNGTCDSNLEEVATSLLDGDFETQSLSNIKHSGRPRKYPVGMNYSKLYPKSTVTKKKTIINTPTQKIPFKKPIEQPRIRTRSVSRGDNDVSVSEVDKVTDSEPSVTTRKIIRRSTKITDFFGHSDSESSVIKLTLVNNTKTPKEKISKKKDTLNETIRPSVQESLIKVPPLDGIKVINSTSKNKKTKIVKEPPQNKSKLSSMLESFLNTDTTTLVPIFNKRRERNSATKRQSKSPEKICDTNVVRTRSSNTPLAGDSIVDIDVHDKKSLSIGAPSNVTNDSNKVDDTTPEKNKATPVTVKTPDNTSPVIPETTRVTRRSQTLSVTFTGSEEVCAEVDNVCKECPKTSECIVVVRKLPKKSPFTKTPGKNIPTTSLQTVTKEIKSIFAENARASVDKKSLKRDLKRQTKTSIEESKTEVPTKKSKKDIETPEIVSKERIKATVNAKTNKKSIKVNKDATDKIQDKGMLANEDNLNNEMNLVTTRKPRMSSITKTKVVQEIVLQMDDSTDIDKVGAKRLSKKLADTIKSPEIVMKRNPKRSSTVVTYNESLSPKRKRMENDGDISLVEDITASNDGVNIMPNIVDSGNKVAMNYNITKYNLTDLDRKCKDAGIDVPNIKKVSGNSVTIKGPLHELKNARKPHINRTFNTDIDSEVADVIPRSFREADRIYLNSDTTGTLQNVSQITKEILKKQPNTERKEYIYTLDDSPKKVEVAKIRTKKPSYKLLDDKILPLTDSPKQLEKVQNKKTLEHIVTLDDSPKKAEVAEIRTKKPSYKLIDDKILPTTENPKRPEKVQNTEKSKERNISNTVPTKSVERKEIATPVAITDPNRSKDTANDRNLFSKTPSKSDVLPLNKSIRSTRDIIDFDPKYKSTPKNIRDIPFAIRGKDVSQRAPDKQNIMNVTPNMDNRSKNEKLKSSIDEKKVKQLQEIFSMKRQELLAEQMARKNNPVLKATWYEGDNGKSVVDETNDDISRIDDLSIIRSPSKSKSVGTADGKEQGLEKLHKLLNKSPHHSVAKDQAHMSPTLLQPFRSLKLNKSLNQSDSSIQES